MFAAAGRDLPAGHDPGHQHLQPVGDRALGRHRPPEQGHRHALLQPGAGHEAGRGRAHRRHRAVGRRGRRGAGRPARQGRRDHRRPGRLHRQRAAVRLPQPRRLDVREPLRQPRGHRRRHAAGLRPADGPAGADGPHRHRHRLRDPRDDVQAVAQPAARAQPAHQADDDRRAARPEVRPRLLHLRRAGLRRGRAPTPRPRPPAAPPRAPARCRPVGVVGSGTMATGIIEVVAKGGYDVTLRRPRAGEGRGGRSRRWPSRWTSRSQRGRLEEAARDEVLARVTGTTSLDDLADRDLVIEAVVEHLRGQAGAVRRPRRDRQARRGAGHHDVQPAGHRVRQGQRPARPTSSACTSSTRRR